MKCKNSLVNLEIAWVNPRGTYRVSRGGHPQPLWKSKVAGNTFSHDPHECAGPAHAASLLTLLFVRRVPGLESTEKGFIRVWSPSLGFKLPKHKCLLLNSRYHNWPAMVMGTSSHMLKRLCCFLGLVVCFFVVVVVVTFLFMLSLSVFLTLLIESNQHFPHLFDLPFLLSKSFLILHTDMNFIHFLPF